MANKAGKLYIRSKVGYLADNRAFNAAASVTNGSHYGVDLSYGDTDVFSRVTECLAYHRSAVQRQTTSAGLCTRKRHLRLGPGRRRCAHHEPVKG